MAKVIYCPINGWDCPYYDNAGRCTMYPETDPIKECDDFAVFWNEGDNYVYDPEEELDFLYAEEQREKENLRDKRNSYQRYCDDD